jgi:cell division protein FtsB
LDSKLQANPNLLFDMLGASEKIALLSRQNDALMLSNKMLEAENTQLQSELYTANEELGKLDFLVTGSAYIKELIMALPSMHKLVCIVSLKC